MLVSSWRSSALLGRSFPENSSSSRTGSAPPLNRKTWRSSFGSTALPEQTPNRLRLSATTTRPDFREIRRFEESEADDGIRAISSLEAIDEFMTTGSWPLDLFRQAPGIVES